METGRTTAHCAAMLAAKVLTTINAPRCEQTSTGNQVGRVAFCENRHRDGKANAKSDPHDRHEETHVGHGYVETIHDEMGDKKEVCPPGHRLQQEDPRNSTESRSLEGLNQTVQPAQQRKRGAFLDRSCLTRVAEKQHQKQEI